MNELNRSTLGDMLTALSESFTKERQKSEPYKELFKAGSSLTGVLRKLDHQMASPVLDACDVISERLGIKVNKNQYHVLLALPLLVKIATEDATKNEGWQCSVDKAFFILSEQFLALADPTPPTEEDAS